jgi:DNA polymerase I
MNEHFVYGPSTRTRIVGVEPHDSYLELFVQEATGQVVSIERPYRSWLLAHNPVGESWVRLKGDLHFNYLRTFPTKREFWDTRKRTQDTWCAFEDKEAAMLLGGFTYYRDLKLEEVGILGFDIEATSLELGPEAKVLCISNTFRQGSRIVRRLFSYDDYPDEAGMFDAWSAWVQELDPSIMAGYNIYDYDLPYLDHCARKAGTLLKLGRGGRAISFNGFESKFRKDGSQFYTYTGVQIYGRETIDVMFLAMKYDQATRKYENFKLKNVVAQEGLEKEGRQHYDGAQIAKRYKEPGEWEKIKRYAQDDADDIPELIYRMAPAYFYLARSVPKPFQAIINGATGSQINSFLVRSYLSEAHSIPKPSEPEDFEGAISLGNPGIYRNVFKADVASLYPSIMLEYQVHDPEKDPLGHFLKMVEHFTNERLDNKARAKETGERYWKDLEQAQKIVINSAYGMLGATGLNFNSPPNARLVTTKGREVLGIGIQVTSEWDLKLANADTDSVSASSPDVPWTEEGRRAFLEELNSRMPPKIHWEDDGVYDAMLVLKAKNYVMRTPDGRLKTKGSALKATLKERALKEFIDRLLRALMDGSPNPLELYREYVREAVQVSDIHRWAAKKTVTERVLMPLRTNEERVASALEGSEYGQGDKVFMYFTTDGSLKLAENWSGDHDPYRLLEKLYKTVKIFETVLNLADFKNYSLKKNRQALAQVLTLTSNA